MKTFKLIVVLAAIPGAYVHAQEQSTDAGSRIIIEDDILHIREEIRDLNQVTKLLTEVRTRIENHTPPVQRVTPGVASQDLYSILQAVEGTSTTQTDVRTAVNTILLKVRSALGPVSSLDFEISSALRIYDRQSRMYREGMAIRSSITSLLSDQYMLLVSEYPFIESISDSDFDIYFFEDEVLDQKDVKLSDFPFVRPLTVMSSEEVSDVFVRLAEKSKSIATEAKASAVAAVNARIASIAKEIEILNGDLATKASELSKLQGRQAAIDTKLIYAVYAMIGVLLLLFLGLKVFSDEVANNLINKRALVEVIGMAFLLITIIILGTGEKLEKPVLGTLLGTIAGYVFARGIQSKTDAGE